MLPTLKNEKRIAIVGGARTPFTRIGTTLRECSAIDLGVGPVNQIAEKFQLKTDSKGLLVFGTVIQHSDVSNIAREVALESNLHPALRAYSTVMACATSLSATVEAALWIARGQTEWAIAGGSESMSNFPVSFPHSFGHLLGDLQFAKSNTQKFKLLTALRPSLIKPKVPPVAERLTGLTMGQHCEMMAKEWKIARSVQDEWAVQTHQRAAAHADWHAKTLVAAPKAKPGALKDNLVRGDTSMERVSKLKPAFDREGTITAASSSPLTDGGAAVLLASEDYARKKGWPILAFIDDFEFAGVDIRNEGLLMAPPYALLRLLDRQKKSLDQFDTVEIHEAFAAQVHCNLQAISSKSWAQSRVELPETRLPSFDRINPRGGSISLGHPFAATGARLVHGLARHLNDTKGQSGIISICAAGGLGLVATLSSGNSV